MNRTDNEEFMVEEYETIEENIIFKAEEFKVLENEKNTFEDFKSKEVDLNSAPQSSPQKKKDISKEINKIKNSLNSISTTVTSTMAIVAAVGIGAVTITPPIVESIEYGEIEFVNYYIDYDYSIDGYTKDIKLCFDNLLDEGYFATVKNVSTDENNEIYNDYVIFEDVSDGILTFELMIYGQNDSLVDSSIFMVEPISTISYLGNKKLDYSLNANNDGTYDLTLILEEASSNIDAYLTGSHGDNLEYDYTHIDNKVMFKNITHTEFNIFVGSYLNQDNNYYLQSRYEIDNFNVLKPSEVNITRLEVLNDSYNMGEGVPTYIYLDGYLTGNDFAIVNVYDASGNELNSITNITDLSKPCVFYDLPVGEDLTFEYKVYNNEKLIKEEAQITNLTIPEEYKSANYEYVTTNPGDTLITYNDDSTYNLYIYTNFTNSSQYEMLHVLQLINDGEVYHEYIGDDKVIAFENISLDKGYSMVYKVFVVDGINHYAIKDFYMASGTIESGMDEEGNFYNSGITVSSSESKKYEVYAYSYIDGDVQVEVILSTGEILNITYTKDEVRQGATLDLSSYEYEYLDMKVSAKVNPNYGLGDLIFDTGVTVKGNMGVLTEVTYSE